MIDFRCLTFCLLFSFMLVACATVDPTPADGAADGVADAAKMSEAADEVLAPTRLRATAVPAIATPPPTATVAEPTTRPTTIIDSPHLWPPPQPQPIDPFARAAATGDEIAVGARLAHTIPPVRDDIALARAYRGQTQNLETIELQVMGPLSVGTRENFRVTTFDQNIVRTLEAELLYVSEHAYFWFDVGPGSVTPSATDLVAAGETFDAIYELDVFYFGPEDNPGVDGDPRVHILHASPLALCNVTLETADDCGLLGYVAGYNVLPVAVDDRSNEREMFVMNARRFGTPIYAGVLAHEFRHMIEANHDQTDETWEKEGSATLAPELIGLESGGVSRANQFLQAPDQQLNRWSSESRSAYYGQAYLFNRYIFDRLGVERYRDFATSPLAGLAAVDAVAATHDLDLTGQSLWLDWLVSLALHHRADAPAKYDYADSLTLQPVAVTQLEPGAQLEETVQQYAADFYLLPASGGEVRFQGRAVVLLIDAVPASGQWFWYAQRANFSNPRLTRTLDLSRVSSATLQYAVYADIEQGYDFGYVSVSADNGQTWQALVADGMQGQAPIDDPADAAFADRFYTGRQQRWVFENIDLSPFAGREIQLRFEYVTDLALNYGGLAFDNIAVPEIGFYDDVEGGEDGWRAEGFVRATAYLPQQWHLQLVTFSDGVPRTELLPLSAGQTLSIPHASANDGDRPILIVAATAPQTLTPAHYRLIAAP